MKMKTFFIALGALAALPILFAACGGSSDNDNKGLLSLSVSDAPVDGAKNVFISFTGVEIKPAGGDPIQIDFPSLREIDLLSYANGASEPLLEEVVMEAGQYEWIRLKVFTDESDPDACRIVLDDDSVYNLTIPSGDQSGLKLNRPFEIPVAGEVAFILDFDLRKSVTLNANGYKLRPTVRIEEVYVTGAIAGAITLLEGNICEEGAVYAFEGASVIPDDVDGVSPDPIASAKPFTDPVSGECRYVVAFLRAGDYTVAATWDSAADDPLIDDPGVTFNPAADATVAAGATTTIDLVQVP